MDEKYWDKKFFAIQDAMEHLNTWGKVETILKQIAADQVKKDIAILEYAKQKDPACIHGFVRAIAAIRAGAPDEKG